jgi:hypothetical protein
MRSSKTPTRTVACVAGLGLVLVQAALAVEKPPIRLSAAITTTSTQSGTTELGKRCLEGRYMNPIGG